MSTKKRGIIPQKEKLIFISVVYEDLTKGCYYVRADEATKLMYNLKKKDSNGKETITRINLIEALNLWRRKGWEYLEDILYFFAMPYIEQETLFYGDDPEEVKSVLEDWNEIAQDDEDEDENDEDKIKENTDFLDFMKICVDIQFTPTAESGQKKSYKIDQNKQEIVDCYGLTIYREFEYRHRC